MPRRRVAFSFGEVDSTATAPKKRHPAHLLQVAIGVKPNDGTPPMAARPMAGGDPDQTPPGPGGMQDQDGDFMHDVQDVIQTLATRFPNNPRVAQIIADIRQLFAEAAQGGNPQGGPGQGPAGPGMGA